MKFVWYDISTSAAWEKFCSIHSPQFSIPNLDIVDIFENIFDTALMQPIVNETNKHAQQEILKTSGPLHFALELGKCQWMKCMSF
jgi:hypothetical protein